MSSSVEVVITGLGVVSPIGSGTDAFFHSLLEGKSGVAPLQRFDVSPAPFRIGGEVTDLDAKQYIKPRKSIKVMCREVQFGVVAANMAVEHAALETPSGDPERCGVLFGCDFIYSEPPEVEPAYRVCSNNGEFVHALWGEKGIHELYPLWMLKYLPNMPACHIAIANDLRGPNNTISLGEVSTLLALGEATRVIRRGMADLMIVGGTGSRAQPGQWVRSGVEEMSRRNDEPAAACRPFDRDRDGMVNGEGAAAFVLESAEHAKRRGATVLARVVSAASAHEPFRQGHPLEGTAIRRSITQALEKAGLAAGDVGHVNANGFSTVVDDRLEAQAIRDCLDDAPVTAPKGHFGNLGSGTGAVEMAASLLALGDGRIPPTLNYEHPDEACPVNVVHGEPLTGRPAVALVLSQSHTGQAAAAVIAAP